MHLDLGGSDSDAPPATSAVKKRNTAESVGVSPHASTSSTSDREQSSIMEKSSVSTDSGMYSSQKFHGKLGSILTLWLSHSGLGSSGASFEVDEIDVCLFSSQPDKYADTEQSPPTEEGNAGQKESSNSIYERHMYLEAHGFPLWIPQPDETLPRSYQRRGVSIGDVGIFTPDGGFDFLFNVCLPAEHPSNPEALPEGFVPLELKLTDVCKFHAHLSHSHLASASVKSRE